MEIGQLSKQNDGRRQCLLFVCRIPCLLGDLSKPPADNILPSTYAMALSPATASRSLSQPLKSNCGMHVPYEPRSNRIGEPRTPMVSRTRMNWIWQLLVTNACRSSLFTKARTSRMGTNQEPCESFTTERDMMSSIIIRRSRGGASRQMGR